jgi:DHA1 family inner membrane transport protein
MMQGRTEELPRAFPWLGFVVLAGVVVLSVATETMPTGLLPDMSATLGVSQPAVGILVTVFALTVAITSVPLIAMTKRWQRQRLILIAVVGLGLSNLLTAVSPDYAVVVASRVVGGLAHGIFWSVVGAYAGHAVPKDQIARAVAITLGGATIGFVFGVPLATSLGHAFGWRWAFAVVALLLFAGAALVWRLLPAVGSSSPPGGGARSGRRDPSVRGVLVVCATALIVMIGHYAFYTYIAPFLIGELGVSPSGVGPFLFLTGIAGAVGLFLAGSVFATRVRTGILVALSVSVLAVACLALFSPLSPVAFPALLLWFVAFDMLPTLLQTRILHVSSVSFRDTGSAVYTATFNIGIGGGALVGALVYGAAGVAALPWVDVGIMVVTLLFVLVVREGSAQPVGKVDDAEVSRASS